MASISVEAGEVGEVRTDCVVKILSLGVANGLAVQQVRQRVKDNYIPWENGNAIVRDEGVYGEEYILWEERESRFVLDMVKFELPARNLSGDVKAIEYVSLVFPSVKCLGEGFRLKIERQKSLGGKLDGEGLPDLENKLQD